MTLQATKPSRYACVESVGEPVGPFCGSPGGASGACLREELISFSIASFHQTFFNYIKPAGSSLCICNLCGSLGSLRYGSRVTCGPTCGPIGGEEPMAQTPFAQFGAVTRGSISGSPPGSGALPLLCGGEGPGGGGGALGFTKRHARGSAVQHMPHRPHLLNLGP